MSASLKDAANAAAARRVPRTVAAALVLRARRLGNGYLAARAREFGWPPVQLPPGVPSLRDVGRGCVVHGLQFDDRLTPHRDEWLPESDFLYRWIVEQDTGMPGLEPRGEWYPYRMD